MEIFPQKFKKFAMKTKPWLLFIALMGWALASVSCSNSKKISSSNPIIADTTVIQDFPLEGTRWRLDEIEGRKIDTSKNLKSVYLVLNNAQNRVEGSGSCNNFAGSYALSSHSKIDFGQLISTKMYCEGIEIENAFFKGLSETNKYSIKKDTLFLGNEIRPKLLKLVAMK